MLGRYRFRHSVWQQRLTPWLKLDWWLLLAVLALLVIGVLAIRSVQIHHPSYNDALQQLIMGAISVVICLLLARWDYENLLQWHWLIYGFTNLLLIAVIYVGTSANGAQNWLTIGTFNIQPSEFAKVGVIITQAALLHKHTAEKIPRLLIVLAVTAVPLGLVFIQPDLGTSLVFCAISLGMLYWANAHPGWIVLMFSPLVSAIAANLALPYNLGITLWLAWTLGMGIVGWYSFAFRFVGAFGAVLVNLAAAGLGKLLWGLLKEYQKDRLTLFLDPSKDPLGAGYHLIQSRIAIGSGGWWGRGLFQGTQTQLGFIPEQHTDFIFAAIGEEWGFLGSVMILGVFWLICFRLLMIARTAKDNFGSLLAIGVLSMVFFQVLINVGMTIGLSPVTGIPLPWLSYGRSALLTNFVALGIVEAVAYARPAPRRHL
jgi:rod shape determining protein RodA